MYFINIKELFFGIFIFIIVLLIGYLGEKRIKNKNDRNKEQELTISKEYKQPDDFSLLDDETINNIF